MAYTDTSIITDPVNVVLQQRFLIRAQQNAPYLAGTMPGRHPTFQGSDTAKWRRYENLTVEQNPTPLAELTGSVAFPTRSASTPTITDVTATVAKYGKYFALNELVDLVNPTTQDNELVDVLGINAGRTINILTRNEMEDNSTIIRAGGAASDTAIVSDTTATNIRQAGNQLARNSALKFTAMTLGSRNISTSPIRAAFWGKCHVDVEEDIRDVASFVPAEQYGSQTTLAQGEFGSTRNIRWISTEDGGIDPNAGGAVGTTGLRTTGGSNIDLYTSVVHGQDAVGTLTFDMPPNPAEVYTAGDMIPSIMLIRKAKGSAGAADPFDEVSTIAWKTWQANKILNADWIRGIRAGATDYS